MIALFSGINFAFAFLAIYVAIKNPKEYSYIAFAIFSLFSGLYLVSIYFQSNFAADISWFTLLSAAIYYSAFGWFTYCFSNLKRPHLAYLASALYVIAFTLYAVQPHNSAWQITAHIGLIVLVIIAFAASLSLVKEKRKTRNEFLFLTIIFAFLAIDEMVFFYSNTSLISDRFGGFLALDAYPLLFSFVIIKRLAFDLFEKEQYKVKLLKAELKETALILERERSQKLELELQYKKQDLTDFGIEISKHRTFLIQLEEMLLAIKEVRASNELQIIVSKIRASISNDKSSAILQDNVKIVNHEFIKNLKTRFPALSKNEVQLCLLLRIQLSSKEIASLKNISVDSVKVLRHRLRKKLEITTGTNLSMFIQSL